MGGTDKILALWENGGGYVGLERRAAGQPFAYYIGMFVPENTPVPDGFEAIDFSGVDLVLNLLSASFASGTRFLLLPDIIMKFLSELVF